MTQRQLTFDDNVRDRIERLLARVEGARLARGIDRPTTFDAAGEAHARRVAAKDRGVVRFSETLAAKP